LGNREKNGVGERPPTTVKTGIRVGDKSGNLPLTKAPWGRQELTLFGGGKTNRGVCVLMGEPKPCMQKGVEERGLSGTGLAEPA